MLLPSLVLNVALVVVGAPLDAPRVVAVETLRTMSIATGHQLQVNAARAFDRMYTAARRDGVWLRVRSALRSRIQQARLHRLYRQGRGNLAAPPGRSMHERGVAVDLRVGSTRSPVYRWLWRNAGRYGFVRTIPSEPWHWEYRPARKRASVPNS